MLRVNITCGDEAYLVRCSALEHELRSWKVGAGSTRTNKVKGAWGVRIEIEDEMVP